MSTVSGCLIVRDEESTIGRLLSELEKFCDEIIVVDTGSIDNTMEICKQFNKVKLFTKEWTYDFAAARNYSFSQATCDYIFGATLMTIYLTILSILFYERFKEMKWWKHCKFNTNIRKM